MPFANHGSSLPADEELSAQKEASKVELNLLAGKIAEAEAQLTTYKDLSQANAELQAEVVGNQEELDKLRYDLVVIKQAISDLVSRKAALEDEFSHAEGDLKLIIESVDSAKATLEKTQRKADELIAMSLGDSKDADAELAGKKVAIAEAQTQLETIQQNVASAQKAMDDLKQAATDVQVDHDGTVASLNNLQAQIAQAQEDLAGLTQAIAQAEANKKGLDDEAIKTRQQIEADKQQAEADIKVRIEAVTEREGQCSLVEKWQSEKAADLMQIKAEVEKFYGKPINIQF